MNTFSYVFLAVLIASLAARLWLARRQIRHVRAHRDRVPEAFRERIPLEAHQRAADYTVAKTRLGIPEAVYDTALLLAWTFGGGLALLDQVWRGMDLSPTTTGVGVLVSALLIMAALDIPFSAYRTFKLEKHFGFNRTTPGTFVADLVKGGILMLVLATPLAWIVLWLMQGSGSLWWVYVWAVWFGFSLLLMWAYPNFIAPLFNRFSPLADEALKARIERLLEQCGFRSQGVFVMDGSRRSTHGNAYFGGMGSNKRIVFFDTLLKQLNAEQIEAVLAHELGHFRLHHITKRLIWTGVFGLLALALLAWLIDQPWFYGGMQAGTPSLYMGLLLFVLLAPVFGFVFTPLTSWLSRRHEFEADAFAAEQRDADALVGALVQLYEDNASTLTPDPLYSRVYDSHPPAPVRIDHLTRKAPAAAGS